MSLADVIEAPRDSLILLAGPPGAGKSTFCYRVVLNGIAMGRPVIFVTTEQGPDEIIGFLREKGLGKLTPGLLNFVDAFGETVGVATRERPDTVGANCDDLNSISMGIAKQQEKIGRRDILLVFDSLTSPYLFNKEEIFRFMRLFLLKFAAEGNSVVALIDEGCGKEEDLVAIMSIADGIIRMEIIENSMIVNVVKHPKVKPTVIETPMTWSPEISYQFDMKMVTHHIEKSMGLRAGPSLRTEVGDFVHVFWPNFARWSGMLWDPKRFPTMTYNSNKHMEFVIEEFISYLPLRARLFLKLMPKDFSKAKDMAKIIAWWARMLEGDRSYILEYLENASKTNEHFIRVHEAATCWGFENVGASLELGTLGSWAGFMKGFEKEDRDWNVIETKCIGLGDPYCEVKFVPGEIDELKDSLESIDNTIIERIHDRLMDRLMGFMLHGKPLWDRPRLGNEISLHAFGHIAILPAVTSERYRMAMRLGGAIGGKKVGEKLMDAGIREDEAVKRILSLLEYCKVGKVSMGETIRIWENCESFMKKAKEPSCFFLTGFLNGFLSTVKNQHVREIKCITTGDPFCEWESI